MAQLLCEWNLIKSEKHIHDLKLSQTMKNHVKSKFKSQ